MPANKTEGKLTNTSPLQPSEGLSQTHYSNEFEAQGAMSKLSKEPPSQP